MPSVEGLWKFQSGSAQEPLVPRWGGVVVLESGRVLGGDSVMAYVGTYEIKHDGIRANVRSWLWNNDVGEVENVFGMGGKIDYMVDMIGQRDGDVIAGTISPEGAPDFKLMFKMEKIAELP